MSDSKQPSGWPSEEQVARALFDVRDNEFDLDEWEDIGSYDRERYECDARAVLPLFEGAVSLAPAERIALTVARAQVGRGDEVTPNIAAVCVMALDRIAARP